MQITPEIESEIISAYTRTQSPFKTAKLVGVDVASVWEIIEKFNQQTKVFPERYGGFGRPELARFTVARQRVTEGCWDNSDPKVAEARRMYEEGTIELMTGRDGAWRILYAFPRKKPRPRPNYFKERYA